MLLYGIVSYSTRGLSIILNFEVVRYSGVENVLCLWVLCFTEEVRYWEGPLSEVPLYFLNFFSFMHKRCVYFPVSNLILNKVIVGMKSTKVQNPRRIVHLVYYANARARKLATPRVVTVRVVLSVLAPIRASNISRHRFGQG